MCVSVGRVTFCQLVKVMLVDVVAHQADSVEIIGPERPKKQAVTPRVDA